MIIGRCRADCARNALFVQRTLCRPDHPAIGRPKAGRKARGGELTWDLRELHDLWWNRVTRAMN